MRYSFSAVNHSVTTLFYPQILPKSLLFRRNDRLHSLFFRLSDQRIHIVCPIRQQTIRFNTFNQQASFLTIRSGTLCNTDSERHTMRIHGQMYLGVEPPFVRLMPSFPPRAPVAWG